MKAEHGKQASLFAQLINKDIILINNIQEQAARKAHKAQHCWAPCKKFQIKKTKQKNKQTYTCAQWRNTNRLVINSDTFEFVDLGIIIDSKLQFDKHYIIRRQ